MALTANFLHDELWELVDNHPALSTSFLSMRMFSTMEATVCCTLSAGRLLLFVKPVIFHQLNLTIGLTLTALGAFFMAGFDMFMTWITCYRVVEYPENPIILNFRVEMGLPEKPVKRNYSLCEPDSTFDESVNTLFELNKTDVEGNYTLFEVNNTIEEGNYTLFDVNSTVEEGSFILFEQDYTCLIEKCFPLSTTNIMLLSALSLEIARLIFVLIKRANEIVPVEGASGNAPRPRVPVVPASSRAQTAAISSSAVVSTSGSEVHVSSGPRATFPSVIVVSSGAGTTTTSATGLVVPATSRAGPMATSAITAVGSSSWPLVPVSSGSGLLSNTSDTSAVAGVPTTWAPGVPTTAPEPSTRVTQVPTSTPEPSTRVTKVPTSAPEPSTRVTKVPNSAPEPSTRVTKVTTSASEPSTRGTKVTTSAPEPSTRVPEVPTSASEPSTWVREVTTSASEPSTRVPGVPFTAFKPVSHGLVVSFTGATWNASSPPKASNIIKVAPASWKNTYTNFGTSDAPSSPAVLDTTELYTHDAGLFLAPQMVIPTAKTGWNPTIKPNLKRQLLSFQRSESFPKISKSAPVQTKGRRRNSLQALFAVNAEETNKTSVATGEETPTPTVTTLATLTSIPTIAVTTISTVTVVPTATLSATQAASATATATGTTRGAVPADEVQLGKKRKQIILAGNIAKELCLRSGSFITLGALFALFVNIGNHYFNFLDQSKILVVIADRFMHYGFTVFLVAIDKDIINYYKEKIQQSGLFSRA